MTKDKQRGKSPVFSREFLTEYIKVALREALAEVSNKQKDRMVQIALNARDERSRRPAFFVMLADTPQKGLF